MKLEWPDVDSTFDLNTIPDEEDYILHLTDDNCPRLDQLQKAVKADPYTQSMLSQID